MKSPEEERLLLYTVARLLTGNLPPDPFPETDSLTSLLVHHGLGALASDRIKHNNHWKTCFSPSGMNYLDKTVIPGKARRKLVSNALKDVYKLFNADSVLLFKGLALGEVYPEVYQRNPGDIDLITRPGEFQQIAATFKNAGWQQLPTVHWKRTNEIQDHYGFAAVFKHPASPVTVDLHRAPVDRTEPFWIPPEDLFAKAVHVMLSEGIEARVPHWEDHLILAALHSVRHGYFRLDWLLDLHFTLQEWKEHIRNDSFYRRCREWKVYRAVRTGLELSMMVYGRQPHPLQHIAMDRWTAWSLQRRSAGNLIHGHMVRQGGGRRVLAMADLLDDMEGMVHYLLHTAFPPVSVLQEANDPDPALGWYVKNRAKTLGSVLWHSK